MLLPALQLVRQVSTARFVYRVVKSEMTSPAASVGAGAMVFGTASGAETVMVELDGTASPPRVAVMVVVPPLRQVIKPSGLTVATAGLLDVNVYSATQHPADRQILVLHVLQAVSGPERGFVRCANAATIPRKD